MIILSSFSCVLIFLNCVELGLNKFRSFLTSIFYSIYPFSIYFSSRYLSETLTEFILLIISLTYLKYSKLNNFRFLFFLAILFGLLTLTRSAFYYLFLLMIFLMFFEKIKFRIKLTKILFLFFSILFNFISMDNKKLHCSWRVCSNFYKIRIRFVVI